MEGRWREEEMEERRCREHGEKPHLMQIGKGSLCSVLINHNSTVITTPTYILHYHLKIPPGNSRKMEILT